MLDFKISIEEKDRDIVLNFLESFQLIQKVELLEESPKYYYNREQTDFSFQDIEAIVAQFPENKKWTAEDLENEYIFPPDCPFKIEILNYNIYIMRPKINHQEILSTLTVYMGSYILSNKLGKIYVAPVGLEISEGTVLEPDIIFISVAKKHLVEDNKKITEAPDLVVEVISPANYKKLREEKKQQYADFGIAEYWEIYPKKQKVRIETLNKDEENEHNCYELYSEASESGNVKSKVLEGFELDIAKIFK